ncbi:MAG: glycogen-debranching protein [Halieaceae bacterium]|nr:glycogen-debranching protein [Halieaceae bacterium]
MPDNKHPASWFAAEGSAFPLGATWVPQDSTYNFALYSKHATEVTLLLFREEDPARPVRQVTLDHHVNKSGCIWHCRLPRAGMRGATHYAYRIDGPEGSDGVGLHAFDADKVLLDPYARQVWFPPDFDRRAAMRPGSNMGRAPLGVLFEEHAEFDWGDDRVRFHEHDLVIYEMHVRGFTRNPNSGVTPGRAGTFLGVVDKIPHLQELGITAVELLPVHQFDPQENNYWGYMTLNFFAPHTEYAVDQDRAFDEFRTMVKALHAAGIEVLLDVVFNHTAEGDDSGPCYSFKGIDNSTYYLTSTDPANPYVNFSGTGNTLHCMNRYVSRMVLDSLRSWQQLGHVDGFRFDLASVFNRRQDGSVTLDNAPIVSAIRADPALGRARLIAEPWDAAGLYQLGGSFPGKRWFQWNGRFRDEMRRFLRGDPDLVASIMCRLYGSDDVFPDDLANACHPYQSVNYINSHDGFTLYDQLAYNERHNEANGEGNRDGHRENYSWNCGWEGDEGVPDQVLALRKQQARNACCLLMLANGTPMFCAGDEFLNTQFGNNNPYCQDNETSWLDWDRLEQNRDVFRFFCRMIAFRKSHPTLARSRFWRADVRWHGTGRDIDMGYESRRLAFYLDGRSQGDADLYVMINAAPEAAVFAAQLSSLAGWKKVVDTGAPSPGDFCEEATAAALSSAAVQLQPRSIVVLVRPR